MNGQTAYLHETIYQQIMLFSEEGKSTISSPNFMLQETHKYTLVPRKNVNQMFRRLIKIGFLEKDSASEYGYNVKEMMSYEEMTKRLEREYNNA